MTYYTNKESRTGNKFVINCIGCSVDDITITRFQGDEVPQEVVVDVKYPAVVKQQFGLTNQTLEFPIAPKFDSSKMELDFGNGILTLEIPIKGGLAQEIKLGKK